MTEKCFWSSTLQIIQDAGFISIKTNLTVNILQNLEIKLKIKTLQSFSVISYHSSADGTWLSIWRKSRWLIQSSLRNFVLKKKNVKMLEC